MSTNAPKQSGKLSGIRTLLASLTGMVAAVSMSATAKDGTLDPKAKAQEIEKMRSEIENALENRFNLSQADYTISRGLNVRFSRRVSDETVAEIKEAFRHYNYPGLTFGREGDDTSYSIQD